MGTVVDSAGSSGRKVEYQGKEYDYVFDVDIEDGKPPLKLPYNLSDNVYDTATNFLGHNNLPLTYLDNVANFITENTKGATIGQSSGPSAPDPFGSEKRYKPGQGEPGVQRKRQLPHKEFLTITQAKFEPIQNKILSLNANLMSAGSKHIALNPSETRILARLVAALNAPASSGTPPNLPEASVDLVVKLVTQWPYSDRLPGLDLLRLMATSPEVAKLKTSEYESVTDMVLASSLDTDGAVNENSVMMAMRTIANLFASDEGRAVAAQHADTVVGAMERVAGIVEGAPPIGAQNRNVQIALASAAFNYALLAYLDQQEGGPAEPRVGPYVVALLCNVLGRVLHDQADAEVVFRALVALGTVLVAGGEGRATARELGAAEWLRRAVARASEDRVKSLARECLAFL